MPAWPRLLFIGDRYLSALLRGRWRRSAHRQALASALGEQAAVGHADQPAGARPDGGPRGMHLGARTADDGLLVVARHLKHTAHQGVHWRTRLQHRLDDRTLVLRRGHEIQAVLKDQDYDEIIPWLREAVRDQEELEKELLEMQRSKRSKS